MTEEPESQQELNKQFVLEYLDAFRTFDPEVYDPYLADEPTYMAGMNINRGRWAFHANTEAGRLLYPRPAEARNEYLAILAEGDWVALLIRRTAPTNKVEDYENIYGMFFEVKDRKIHTQVELMDFRVSTDKFDLSVLDPNRNRTPP